MSILALQGRKKRFAQLPMSSIVEALPEGRSYASYLERGRLGCSPPIGPMTRHHMERDHSVKSARYLSMAARARS